VEKIYSFDKFFPINNLACEFFCVSHVDDPAAWDPKFRRPPTSTIHQQLGLWKLCKTGSARAQRHP